MTDNLPERAAIVANKNLVQLDIDQMFRFAQGYARAGFLQGKDFNSVATPEDLFVRISAGQAIGLDPYTSVSEFYFVKGKLTMSTNLQLALAKASGKYDYRVEWGNSLQDVGIEKDGPGGFLAEGLTLAEVASWPTPRWCRVTVYSAGEREVIGESLWTLVDSWRAKLLAPSRNGEPSNHLKYPRAMLFNRAGSSAVAYYMPDATMIRAYDHGEVEGDVWSEPRGPSTVTAEVVPEEPADTRQHREAVEANEEVIQDADVEEVHIPEDQREGDPEGGARAASGAAKPYDGPSIHDMIHAKLPDPMTPAHDAVTGEVLPGESPADAMARMVAEEALEPFEPETTPPPPVVTPPGDESPPWATGESEQQPTVETSAHDPVISSGKRGLVMALAGKAGLTDTRRHAIVAEITGQPHSDRIPERLFQKVVDRLNAEVEIAQQEVDAVGQGDA